MRLDFLSTTLLLKFTIEGFMKQAGCQAPLERTPFSTRSMEVASEATKRGRSVLAGYSDGRARDSDRIMVRLAGSKPAACAKGFSSTSRDRAVKVTVFLKNISDFQAMNEVYAKFFPGVPPERSTVQAVLPNEAALIEIDVIAMQ